MAKITRMPLGRKAEQQKIELPERVCVELGELATKAKEGLLAFAVAVGLEVFRTMLEEDISRAAGPKGKHNPTRAALRHGAEPSSLVLGGRKVAVDRPRVRGVAGGEVCLPSWQAFSGEQLLSDQVLMSVLAGVSSRSYAGALEPVGEDLDTSCTSRSAVSRRFVARTSKALDELMSKDISELSMCALFADGLEEAGHTIVSVIGLDQQGNKHILGLREGSTENKTVCRELLSSLVERGLDFSGGVLLVIDGGKGLRAAAKEIFGDLGLIQRCRCHKRRNVLDHLPKEKQAGVGRRLDAAWNKDDYAGALAGLKGEAKRLEKDHPGAAASLREGMEETITINALGVGPVLTKTLSSTNPIESAHSVARTVMRNVKRWRSGEMVLRWTAAGMEQAASRFRKVKGYKEIAKLIAKLHSHAEALSASDDKVA